MTLSDPVNCSLTGSSVHGIFQARVLEWVVIAFSIEKARELKKRSTSASLIMLKPLTVWITTNCNILKEIQISDHLTWLLETCMQNKKQQLKPDVE